jgi:signal peptidase II
MKLKKINIPNLLISVSIIVVLFLIDIFSKRISEYYKPMDQVIIPYFITFSYLKNEGAAYGLLGDSPIVLWIFTIISIGLLVYLFLSFDLKKRRLYSVSLLMLAPGAIGNVFDRIFLGYVIDFINYPFLGFLGDWGNFSNNFADLYLTAGIVILLIYYIFFEPKERKKEKKENEPESN